jgi:molecular chaperone DnaJ
MNTGNSFYHLLGVQPGVSRVEIKRAYRRLVKSMHPDVGHQEQSLEQRSEATERMMRINEAYETLMDSSKRAAYDASIGLNRAPRNLPPGGHLVDEDEARERYLRQVFHPYRQEIAKILGLYQRQLRRLSLDIYDDELVSAFEHYVDRVEVALRRGAEAFSREEGPQSLEAAIQMMRYSIAQAVDGLEEMRRFCQNYDYDHLTMAGNLFRIANDLSRQSVKLTRL